MHNFLQLIYFSIIIIAPVPLVLLAISSSQNNHQLENSVTHKTLLLLSYWCILQISVGLTLGIVHNLTLAYLLSSELVIFSIGLAMLHKKHINYSPKEIKFKLYNSFKQLSLPVIITLIVFFFVAIALFINLLIIPITDYDSLAYHLPIMAHWYQSGSFDITEQWKNQIQSTYPYNWEVFSTLLLFPFQEDLAVSIPNFIAWLIFGLVIYRLCRMLNLEQTYSMIPAILVMTMPDVMNHINTMHIDLAFAAFFLLGLYSIMCYQLTQQFIFLVFFSAIVGMLLGIKMSGVIYVALLIGVFGVFKLYSVSILGQKFINQQNLWAVALGSCIIVLLGGYWYFRNFIILGNPLGFVKVEFNHIVLFPGSMESEFIAKTTLANIFDFFNILHWKMFFEQLFEIFYLPFVILTFFVLALVFNLTKIIRQSNNMQLFGIIGLVLITGWLYFTTPFSGDNGSHNWQMDPWIKFGLRYGYPFIGLFSILSAYGLNYIKPRDENLMLLTIASMLFSMPHSTIIPINGYLSGFILIVLMVVTKTRLMRKLSLQRYLEKEDKLGELRNNTLLLAVFGVILLIITPLLLNHIRNIRGEQRINIHGDAVKFIDALPRQTTIGFVSSHKSYLLFGDNYQMRVKYVPTQSTEFSEWLNYLKEQGVSYIAIGPEIDGDTPPTELFWLDHFDKTFERLHGKIFKQDLLIYKLNQ